MLKHALIFKVWECKTKLKAPIETRQNTGTKDFSTVTMEPKGNGVVFFKRLRKKQNWVSSEGIFQESK